MTDFSHDLSDSLHDMSEKMSLTLKLHVGELMTSDGYLSELFVAEVEMYMSDFIDF